MNIHIEFCIKWNYGPEFDRVSKLINNLFPDYIITGNKVSPRPGAFEVSISDKIIFSKFDTGNFPTESDIKSWFN